MKAVVLAGLVIVALMVALWMSISGDPEAAVVSDHHETKAVVAPPEARPAPVAPRTATIPKATTPRPVPMHEQAPAQPMPTMEAQGSGSDANKADPFRDELTEQVKFTEGAIADCVDAAKKKGGLPNGDASYGFYLGYAEGKVFVEKMTTEYGPFPAEFNDCVANGASTVAIDKLPPMTKHIAVFRGVRITNGELKRNSLLNYEIVDNVPN
ncbi:MAG TPA: hypothetical protein VGM90_26780 [Kofleriaceae bacterium]|jgi:hypothetical protein